MQKARAAFNQGDCLPVADMAASATTRLLVAACELDAATFPGGHRRR